MKTSTNQLSRRVLLRMGASIPPLLLAACVAPAPQKATTPPDDAAIADDLPTSASVTQGEQSAAGVAQLLSPTPICDDGDEPTPAQTDGPYYTPNTPERASFLEPDIVGTKMMVAGYVFSTDCRPIARALLDFWHCDDTGVYDNAGYKLRGHFFSDDQGRYQLETIMPGLYPGRTRHFHVKVQAPNQPILTTQLYFPNESANENDGIFRTECLMDVEDTSDGKLGIYDFVLQLA